MIAPLSLTTLAAEVGMMGGLCSLIMLECIAKWRQHVMLLAIAICFVLGAVIITRTNPGVHGIFVHDAFTSFAQLASLILMGGVMLWSKQRSAEWLALMFASLLGMLLVAASYDFLMLFFAAELMSMPLYAMMAMKRHKSQEAALKYIILSALAGVLYLYSTSWLYGLTGSTHFSDMGHMIALVASDTRVTFAFVGIMAALAFKCAAAPFHVWVGDVYHGAPTPLLIVLAGAPKLVMLMAWMRIVSGPFSSLQPHMGKLFIGLAIISMFIGGLVALRQNHIKRLLAYSSVGHVGFALLGFVHGDAQGLQASTLYITLYVFTLTAAIGVWHFLKKQCTVPHTVCPRHSLARLAYTKETLGSIVLVLLLLSMAGVPPMPGFLAKWVMIKTLLQQQHTTLALMAVVYSIVSVGYTLNIVRVIYATPESGVTASSCKPETSKQRAALFVVIAAMVLVMIVPRPFLSCVTCAINSLALSVNY